MSWKIAVLGGSSSFTLSLIDALVDQASSLPRFSLALHGRDESNLATVGDYARRRLGDAADPPVFSTDIATILSGADVVLHQIRYGGLDLRGEGETLCERFRVAADETLGPAALLTALVIREQVATTADHIARHCRNAWVLNLTNPLSCVTAWMRERLEHVIGLCELPLYTLHQAAAAAGVPADAIDFAYTGFNHRGFFYRLRAGDMDLLAKLGAMGDDVSIGGISGTAIAELGALPLKYFSLRDAAWAPQQRRAAALRDLSARIFKEVRRRPSASPPSLGERYLAWYPMSVVPMLAALGSARPSLQACNLPRPDGLIVERFVTVANAGICAPEDIPLPLPPTVAAWNRRYERHERAFLRAVERPSMATLTEALAEDPSMPSTAVDAVAEATLASRQTMRSRSMVRS